MAAFPAARLLLCLCVVSTLGVVYSEASFCAPESRRFLLTLAQQCLVDVSPSVALEVDGEYVDRFLSSKKKHGYTSILLYASWCPFSRQARRIFDVLSFMFPQITHLAAEESKVMPIIFSICGIHSVPALLMVNQTSRIRFHGPKDLYSFVQFYEKTTGYKPVGYYAIDEATSPGAEKHILSQSGSSKILRREPYLILSVVFLSLKGFVHFFPQILSQLKAFWILCTWHLNFGIFRGTSQLLERVLQVVNLKRAWSRLRLCKTRNFHNGAKNARVWASSLASVSLGDHHRQD